jgi:hypothetical protein
METVAFFERKVALTPKDLNVLHKKSIEVILLEKINELLEKKCTEHGFVIPGSIKIISRSVGYYESARFTADTVYYVKCEAHVINSVEGVTVQAEVIRKNKMGIYAVHRDAIRILVPRDLHLGNIDYDAVNIGDTIDIELRAKKAQINDPFIFATGVFIKKSGSSKPVIDTVEDISEEVSEE